MLARAIFHPAYSATVTHVGPHKGFLTYAPGKRAVRTFSSSSLVGQPLVGESGRVYLRTKELKSDTSVHQRSVYLAEWENQTFVLKRVSDHTYKKCNWLNAKFTGSVRLRQHIDENENEQTFVYEHFKGNLFHFMNAYRDALPTEIIDRVMWETGQALMEMHDKKVMHVDLKPDNILLNWKDTDLLNGMATPPVIGKVILSDLDTALDMKDAWLVRPAKEFRDLRFGNVRWRAPEMQTGQGIGLFSDIFAYGLIYVYMVTGQVPLGEMSYDELADAAGMSPEEVALGITMELFGPLTAEFLKHTADEKWEEALKGLSALVGENQGENSKDRFENWDITEFPRLTSDLQGLLSKILKFTPAERLSIAQVLGSGYWKNKR